MMQGTGWNPDVCLYRIAASLQHRSGRSPEDDPLAGGDFRGGTSFGRAECAAPLLHEGQTIMIKPGRSDHHVGGVPISHPHKTDLSDFSHRNGGTVRMPF